MKAQGWRSLSSGLSCPTGWIHQGDLHFPLQFIGLQFGSELEQTIQQER
jgi:hypothetical protein